MRFAIVLLLSMTLCFGSSHREAPNGALDQQASIKDFFAFVSYDDPGKVTFIMDVNGFLAPAARGEVFPFGPGVVYAIHANDAAVETSFEFRFKTIADGPSQRQTYSVAMIRGGERTDMSGDNALCASGTKPYDIGKGVRVWAGLADDPSFIDLAAMTDPKNVRKVLTAAQDASLSNSSPDAMAGFNVNAIAIEVPVGLIASKSAMIEAWATTSRPKLTVKLTAGAAAAGMVEIQRMGSPEGGVLRLDTSVAPSEAAARNRLGLLSGDKAGYPNGRRLSDDVIDIAMRRADGSGLALGDGVNSNDVPFQETFPYLARAHEAVAARKP